MYHAEFKWTKETTSTLEKIFGSHLQADLLPNRQEIEDAIGENPSTMPNIHYRKIVYKLHSMRQTIRRRNKKPVKP